MFQKDLSKHHYTRNDYPDNVLAVGWLHSGDEFTRGQTDSSVVAKLRSIEVVNLTRGHHVCEFCDRGHFDDNARGNGEIWVQGEDGFIYAMPVLTIHYIEAHEYKLPICVEKAVMIHRAGSTVPFLARNSERLANLAAALRNREDRRASSVQ